MKWLWSLAAFIGAWLVACDVEASVIGVGLDWRKGVFVQEYWRDGAPLYLLANLSDKPVTIAVHAYEPKWRLGDPLPDALAGPWKVPASGHTTVGAESLRGEQLTRFILDGTTPLGLLPGPSDPGYDGKGYVTRLGLSGSGGARAGLYIVQPGLSLEPGSTVTLTLFLPTNAGVLTFAIPKDHGADGLRPSQLALQSASSITLPVTNEEGAITIDTRKPKTTADKHEVLLKLVTPQPPTSRIYLLHGWLGSGGGGMGVTRGLLIDAAANPN